MLINIFSVASRDLLVSVINFGISSLLARALEKEVLGIWFALQTMFLVCDSILRYRSDVVMVLRYKSGENPAALGSQFVIAAASSLVIFLIALIFSNLIFNKIQFIVPLKDPWAVKVVLTSLSMSVLVSTYIYYLTAQKAFQRYNLILIGQALVNFAVVGGMVLFGSKTVMVPVTGQLATWLLVLPIAIMTLLSLRRDVAWHEVKILGKEGIHFQFNSVIATFQSQIPRLFALFFLTIEDLADIGLIFILVSLMLKYPSAINTVFFAETKSEMNLKSYRPVLIKLCLFTILIYTLAFFLSPLVINLAFGSQYVDIAFAFQSILIFVLFHSLGVIVLGLRNIIGDYTSMNMCICLGALVQCSYLLISENLFESALFSYAVFSVGFFCLSCFYARSTLREILY